MHLWIFYRCTASYHWKKLEVKPVGIIVAITYKDEQNIFIKLQIYCERDFQSLAAVNILWKERQWFRFPHYKSSYPWSLIAFGAWYFAWGKEVLFTLCLSLSHGTATSSYHKTPPRGEPAFVFYFTVCRLIWNIKYRYGQALSSTNSYCGHNLYQT